MFLVFDFDGTLADTHTAFREAFDEAARMMRVQLFRMQDEDYLRTLEASDVLRAHGILPGQFADFTGLLKQGMESRRSHIRLVPGVDDALFALEKMKIPLGLITSNSESLVRSVLAEQSELFAYLRFDVSINAKAAVLASAASDHAHFGPLQYVGDEIRDFRAAVAANVAFSAVTWGYNTEDSLRKQGCEKFIRHPNEFARIQPTTDYGSARNVESNV